ncbi:MAG: integrase arm-type DNA-binding domain-containing protein [Gammaproteobacteria bacterium]|nr:integrase arm-type DNA-binding domain-containing protein [Gammaproteobacteria bacterium]
MKLTETRIKRLAEPGIYAAGEVRTLHLRISKSGAKRWIQRVTIAGQRTDLGLGSWPVVTLQMARDEALENLRAIRRGDDPRHKPAPAPLFRKACAESDTTAGRNSETRQAALDTYCRRLMDRRVDAIGREDVLKVLVPIWTEKPNLARKLRGWIKGALSWAQGHGHVEHNYAGDIIDGALPRQASKPDAHHAAVPFADLPATVEAVSLLTGSDSVRDCLTFTILTAVRSGEAREADWSEVDLEGRTWTIPAARMKASREHVVPLSDAAVAILERRKAASRGAGYIFRGRTPSQPISRASMAHMLARVAPDATVHGMRSAFRDWAGETTSTPREVLEHCLAHRVGNAVEQAYARGTLLAKRRVVMEHWAAFVTGQHAKVVRFAS